MVREWVTEATCVLHATLSFLTKFLTFSPFTKFRGLFEMFESLGGYLIKDITWGDLLYFAQKLYLKKRTSGEYLFEGFTKPVISNSTSFDFLSTSVGDLEIKFRWLSSLEFGVFLASLLLVLQSFIHDLLRFVLVQLWHLQSSSSVVSFRFTATYF